MKRIKARYVFAGIYLLIVALSWINAFLGGDTYGMGVVFVIMPWPLLAFLVDIENFIEHTLPELLNLQPYSEVIFYVCFSTLYGLAAGINSYVLYRIGRIVDRRRIIRLGIDDVPTDKV